MKKIIFNFVKIILSLTTIPLWFVYFYHDKASLPNDKGNLVDVVFKHNLYQNMDALDLLFVFYVSIVIVIVSVVLSVISIKTTDKRTKIISNIVSISTILFFLFCLGIGSTVQRCY